MDASGGGALFGAVLYFTLIGWGLHVTDVSSLPLVMSMVPAPFYWIFAGSYAGSRNPALRESAFKMTITQVIIAFGAFVLWGRERWLVVADPETALRTLGPYLATVLIFVLWSRR
jgi:hypothetical protein